MPELPISKAHQDHSSSLITSTATCFLLKDVQNKQCPQLSSTALRTSCKMTT